MSNIVVEITVPTTEVEVTSSPEVIEVGIQGPVGPAGPTGETGIGVIPRTVSIVSSATPTPNVDTTDDYIITALAETATFGEPTGTPVNGQKLFIRVKDNGTAKTLAWNSIYRGIATVLPVITYASKQLYIGFKYNSTDLKWDCLAVCQEI